MLFFPFLYHSTELFNYLTPLLSSPSLNESQPCSQSSLSSQFRLRSLIDHRSLSSFLWSQHDLVQLRSPRHPRGPRQVYFCCASPSSTSKIRSGRGRSRSTGEAETWAWPEVVPPGVWWWGRARWDRRYRGREISRWGGEREQTCNDRHQ